MWKKTLWQVKLAIPNIHSVIDQAIATAVATAASSEQGPPKFENAHNHLEADFVFDPFQERVPRES